MPNRSWPALWMRRLAGSAWIAMAALSAIAAPKPAATTQPAPATQPAGPSFSVATYNINYGNPNLKGVVRAIRQAGADLVCLQETNAMSQRYLRRHLTAPYRFARFRNDRQWAGGFGFLSKTPLKSFQYLPPKYGPFGSWLCVAKLAGQDVQIANVHLTPMLPRQGATFTQLLAQIRQTDGKRQKEIAYLQGRLSNRLPVIVAGDMNAPPYLASAKFLAGKGFTDSFHAAHPDAPEVATWHWKWRGVDWRFRLDYIYHSRHMRTCMGQVVLTEASDHYLVISRMRWAPGDQAPTTAPAPPANKKLPWRR